MDTDFMKGSVISATAETWVAMFELLSSLLTYRRSKNVVRAEGLEPSWAV